METTGNKPGRRRCLPSVPHLQYWTIPSLNRPEATPCNVARPNRDTKHPRNARDIRERSPSRKTPMDSHSKLKARTIKN